MNLALFYDTETTGLPLWNDPSSDPRQPHLVQLGACLVDLDTKATVASMDTIIRPNGYVITDDVAAIHGITTERAMDVGVGLGVAIEMFLELYGGSRLRIGHNESFDARIMRITLKRTHSDTIADIWKAGRAECTQRLATPILKIPPTPKMVAASRFHFKSANLGEAYKHFTGLELANAHSAMADVQACMAVYCAIMSARGGEAAA